MASLKILREGWDSLESTETELLSGRSVQDNVREYFDLLAEFGRWNDAVEAAYQAEREETLIALQERLARLP